MSITANWYPDYPRALAEGDTDIANTYNVALLDVTGTFNAAHTEFSDVSASEVSGTNYAAAPIAFTVSRVGTETRFLFEQVEWLNVTVTARNAVIYDSVTDALVMHLASSADIEATAQTLRLNAPSPVPFFEPVIP